MTGAFIFYDLCHVCSCYSSLPPVLPIAIFDVKILFMQSLLLASTSFKSLAGPMQFAGVLAKHIGCPLTVLQVVNAPLLSQTCADELETAQLLNATTDYESNEPHVQNNTQFIFKKEVDFWTAIEQTAKIIGAGITLVSWTDVADDALINISGILKKTSQPVLLIPENMRAFMSVFHIGLLGGNNHTTHVQEDKYTQQLARLFAQGNNKDVLITHLNTEAFLHNKPNLSKTEVDVILPVAAGVAAWLKETQVGQKPGFDNNIEILAIPVTATAATQPFWLNELLRAMVEHFNIPVLLLHAEQTPKTEKKVCPQTEACKMCPNCRKKANVKAIEIAMV